VFLGPAPRHLDDARYAAADPVSGTLRQLRYRGAHNSFSLAASRQQALEAFSPPW